MHSFSLLDTYDPSANSTGYPYKESILMVSLARRLTVDGGVPLRVESAELARAQPANSSPIRQRPAGACPGRSSLDCPNAVSTAEREGLVAAAVAGRRRALLLEAFAAVDRLVVPRLEGDFSLLAAGRAHGRIHLARSGGVTTAAARGVATTTAGISAAGIATTAAAGVATRGATAVVAAGRALSLALRPAIGAT